MIDDRVAEFPKKLYKTFMNPIDIYGVKKPAAV